MTGLALSGSKGRFRIPWSVSSRFFRAVRCCHFPSYKDDLVHNAAHVGFLRKRRNRREIVVLRVLAFSYSTHTFRYLWRWSYIKRQDNIFFFIFYSYFFSIIIILLRLELSAAFARCVTYPKANALQKLLLFEHSSSHSEMLTTATLEKMSMPGNLDPMATLV